MSKPLDDAAHLAAQLIARRYLPRNHPLVKRALIDTELWAELERRLAEVGLRVVDNLYADHISVALLRPAEVAVFGETGLAANNNLDLPRDGVALLIVLWALIVLPKRQRQVARADVQSLGQNEMFATDKPLPLAASVSPLVSYRSLLADFGNQLGKKTRLDTNLRALERHGFIVRKGEDSIGEGPLLDLLLDYDTLAPRILDGALADVLASSAQPG